MAIVKFGGGVVGMRGTAGGQTYSANGSGNFVRAWARPVKSPTAKQLLQRSRLAGMKARWTGLSDAQRTGWCTWAALPANERFNSLGESYYLSGWQAMVEINSRLSVMGDALRSDAPTDSVPAAPVGGNFLWYWNATYVECRPGFAVDTFVADRYLLFGRIVVNGVRRVNSSGWRLIQKGGPLAAGAYSVQCGVSATALWGTPQVGWQLFVRLFRQTSQGVRSLPYEWTRTYYIAA